MCNNKTSTETYIKKTLPLKNVSVNEITEQIDLINAGNSQHVIATMWQKISPDGAPGVYDAIIIYEVDYRALAYLNKKETIKLPKV